MPDLNPSEEWEVQVIEPNSVHYPAMLELREALLRKPLGLEISVTDLEEEAEQIHFVLLNRETEKLEGCGMIIEKPNGLAKVRQVAISEAFRGSGLGRFLMSEIEAEARRRNFSEIQLHARDSAVPFYERIGYETDGDSFIEVTLPHFLMRKELT